MGFDFPFQKRWLFQCYFVCLQYYLSKTEQIMKYPIGIQVPADFVSRQQLSDCGPKGKIFPESGVIISKIMGFYTGVERSTSRTADR